MKRVLLYGMCGMDNLGDDLMYYSISDYLHNRDIEVDFASRMRWCPYFKEEKVPSCIELPIYNVKRNNVTSRVNKLLPFTKPIYHKVLLSELSAYFESKQYDALVFLGGGYITSNRTVMSESELRNILLLVEGGKNAGLQVIFSGVTVGPFDENNNVKHIARKILSLADTISVREKYSYNELNDMGIQCSLTGDNIFLLDRNPSLNKRQSQYILANIKFHKEQSNSIEEKQKEIIELCRDSMYPVIVLPFRSDLESEEYKLNQSFCSTLKANGIKCDLIIPSSIAELMQLFFESEFVIGSAYHSVALALFFCKKVYTWYQGEYYTYKIKGITDMFTKLSMGQGIQAYCATVDQRNEIRNRVISEWNNIINMVNENGKI